MSEPVISVENVSKRYVIGHQRCKDDGLRHAIEDAVRAPFRWMRGRREQKKQEREEFWALKDISFDVKPGEVLGIIGRNGAGKSTLLKILSRITEPTAGRISIDGRVASLLEVGTGFHPELTGRENIFLNGAILGMANVEIKRKFDEIVAFAEIDKFLDTPVKRYSSGMYVRLAFAVAAHLEPEILIVDEVLAVGDSDFQKKCIGKMQEVSRSGGRTVLFVSHNLAAVQKLCTSTLLLEKGTISSFGPTSLVLDRYLRSSYSAARARADLTGPEVRRHGTGRVKFTAITITDENGHPMSEIAMGQNFIVDLSLSSSVSRSSVLMGFSFISSDEIEIMGTAAHDGGVELQMTPGEHAFRCFVSPNVLLPGRYAIRAAVFVPEKEVFDHINELLTFEISEVRANDSKTPSSHKVGHVYVPYQWQNLSETIPCVPLESLDPVM
jgi:lipopolysaccharide transport system ATP-binding protein